VGDYRIVCTIEDQVLRILVVRVGNRREVYR
jgi:mRNA interferase RelE/StbE